MRKKTLYYIADKLLWLCLILLPLIIWAIGSHNGIYTLGSVFNEIGINNDNFIYQALYDLFGAGSDSIIHFFTQDSLLLVYFTYFIIVEIVHLFVDFILFIPRLSHKWLNSFTRMEEV